MRCKTLTMTFVWAAMLASLPARAQTLEGFAIQQFAPAPTGDRFFAVPDADVRGHLALRGMVIANYGARPLRVVDHATGGNVGDISAGQVYAHIDASMALYDRVLINADIPVAVAQWGEGGLEGAPHGAAFGDLRLGLRGKLLGTADSTVSFGAEVNAWAPTGSKMELTSDGAFRVNPRLVASGRKRMFIYAANAGVLFRKTNDAGDASVGSALTFGAGAGVLLAQERLQVGPEIYGSAILPHASSDMKFFSSHATPVEAVLGAKLRTGPMVFGAAMGPGLTLAPGTPTFRALASVAIAPEPERKPPPPVCSGPEAELPADCFVKVHPITPVSDRDHDGIPDSSDACPDQAGERSSFAAENGCPDRDHDSVADLVDACPDVAGVRSDDRAKNGCPPDRDGDLVPDAQDACPDVPGVKSDVAALNGCPPDRDHDGIADASDACPDQAGEPDPDPKKNGCPKLAKLENGEVKIREQIHFQTAKANILPDSGTILGAVAEVINQHPEITLLTIEGHTDNVGSKELNKQLSARRAESVKAWLVAHGVAAKRLITTGWGSERPIRDNDSDDGRSQNRRVEFHVVKGL